MTAREAAVQALLAFEQRGAWSDAYLNGLLRRERLEPRDAALCVRITTGVLQNRMLCDWYLQPYVRGSLQPAVRAILRSAVCQLICFTRIPVNAVVNESVELAKKLANPAAAKVVNAILRRLTAQPLPQPPQGMDAESLSLRHSHPLWLTEYLLSACGAERTEQILLRNDLPPVTALRVNRLRADPEQAAACLREDGLEPVPLVFPDFLGVRDPGNLTRLRAFREGLVTVQDPAAALPALCAAVEPGMRILDACAAPGGKSFLLAQRMSNCGELLSCDVQEKKLARIREGAGRLGITCIHTRAMDARSPDRELAGRFDLVLADAPCSGMGVIRKKPEIRYKDPKTLVELPALQGAILDGLAPCVQPGGSLVYSTCTLLRAENEAVTAAFLARHPEFARAPLPLPEPFGLQPEGERTIWPDEYDTDGFYLCLLQRQT